MLFRSEVPFDERETPTPEALREECLKRMEEAIRLESDPAKLARAVETLNKMMDPTDKGKEKKSIADAVAEAMKSVTDANITGNTSKADGQDILDEARLGESIVQVEGCPYVGAQYSIHSHR